MTIFTSYTEELAANIFALKMAINPKPEIEWFITTNGVKMPAKHMRNACNYSDKHGGVVSWEVSE